MIDYGVSTKELQLVDSNQLYNRIQKLVEKREIQFIKKTQMETKKDFDVSILGGSVKHKIVNPDLLEERAKCDFNKQELVDYIIPVQTQQKIKKFTDLIEKHPEMKSDFNYFEMSRLEMMEEWWRRYRLIMQSADMNYVLTNNSQMHDYQFTWHFLFPGVSPNTLHQNMFAVSLLTLASEQQ